MLLRRRLDDLFHSPLTEIPADPGGPGLETELQELPAEVLAAARPSEPEETPLPEELPQLYTARCPLCGSHVLVKYDPHTGTLDLGDRMVEALSIMGGFSVTRLKRNLADGVRSPGHWALICFQCVSNLENHGITGP